MYCKNCGAKLEDDARFCVSCGAEVENVSAPVADAPEEKNVSKTSEPSEPRAGEKKPTGSRIKILIGAAAAVVVIAAAVLFLRSPMTGEKLETDIYSQSNFHTDGAFAYDDERLYFVAYYNEDDDDSSLYSTDYSGGDKKLISDNGNIGRIRLSGEKIYYNTTDSDAEEYTLGAINKDGTGKETIVDLTENCVEFSVGNDILYYLTEGKLHAYDQKKDTDTVLVESAEQFTLGEDKIFFTDGDTVNYCGLDGEETVKLCDAETPSMLVADGNMLYFKCETGISRISADAPGTAAKIAEDDSVFSYVFYGDKIYYTSMYDADELLDMGALMETLNDDSTLTGTEYAYLMVGSGPIYCVDKEGGNAEKADTDQIAAFSLYDYPNGLYYKISFLSEKIEPLTFN